MVHVCEEVQFAFITEDLLLSDTCQWNKTATGNKKVLDNKIGVIYQRFGATIINIKGKAYNPCNLPANLVGKVTERTH